LLSTGLPLSSTSFLMISSVGGIISSRSIAFSSGSSSPSRSSNSKLRALISLPDFGFAPGLGMGRAPPSEDGGDGPKVRSAPDRGPLLPGRGLPLLGGADGLPGCGPSLSPGLGGPGRTGSLDAPAAGLANAVDADAVVVEAEAPGALFSSGAFSAGALLVVAASLPGRDSSRPLMPPPGGLSTPLSGSDSLSSEVACPGLAVGVLTGAAAADGADGPEALV
jgi:hypothetical protein